MSATDRTAASAPAAGDLAASVRETGFVRLVAAADGDALAATGLLARALSAVEIPFQASVARTDPELARRLDNAEDALALTVGASIPTETESAGVHAVPGRGGPASVTAYAVARELGADPNPVLALAGAFATGVPPGGGETAAILETARETGAVERRPGVAIPTADSVDGLAHTTLVHAAFSADGETAAELVADAGIDPSPDSAALDEDDARRTLASLVALEAVGDEDASTRSADAVERVLRPYATPGGPFATVGGYADVLEAAAREQPGSGVALALESEPESESATVEATIDAWRAHSRAAHEAVRETTTGRYDGLFAARVDDAPVETVARLLLGYRSPEPAVLVVGDDEAAALADLGTADANDERSSGPVDDAMRAAVETVGGEAGGRPHRAYAKHDGEPRDFISAYREARR